MTGGVDERERLRGYVDKSRGHFSLALAQYGDEADGQALWEALVGELRELGVIVALVDFSAANADVDMMARLAAATADADALFVVGLEQLLVEDDRPRPTRAVATLNFNRDLLRERVPVPVVLWLSQRATRALALLASDTFDVARTSFDFPIAEVEAEASAASMSMSKRAKPDPGQMSFRWPPRWLSRAPKAEFPRLQVRLETLDALLTEAEPQRAGDLAASLADTFIALGQDDEAGHWLEEAVRLHRETGNLGAATTARRQLGELLWFHGRDEEAEEQLDAAWALASRIAGSDEPASIAAARPDILAARSRLTETTGAREPDSMLVERWRKGDRQAGDMLLRRYYPLLWRYFVSRTQTADIGDLIQSVFLRILAFSSHDLRNTRLMIFRLARDVLANFSMEHRSTTGELAKESLMLASSTTDTRVSDAQALLNAVQQLPIEDADVIDMHFFHDLSIEEIAEIYEAPPPRVHLVLLRALSRLAQAVATTANGRLSEPDIETELRALGRYLRRASQ